MLTISQLAEYAGTTVRAVRHYHAVGLLPEPGLDASGYRTYGAQDVVDLRRIRMLADAGVPLKRIGELLGATPAELRDAVAEIDRDLRSRIGALQATRRELARLADEDEPFLPEGVAELHALMRSLGIAERTLDMDREGWILTGALYPTLVEKWVAMQRGMLDDAEYRALMVATDGCFDWSPDDPRLETLARRTVAFMRSLPLPDPDAWDNDATAYQLVTTYRRAESPAWARLMERVAELLEAGGVDDQEQQWDERYSSSERVWSGAPNAALVAEVAGLAPGTALDVGCGEGADSVWLAQQGWQVTGLDVSGVALARARAWADENDVEVTWVKNGLLEAGLPPRSFDLVAVFYAPLARSPEATVERALAGLVAPGGQLVVVHHAPPAPGEGQGHGHGHGRGQGEHQGPDFGAMVAPESVRPVLGDGWTIEVDDTRERAVSGGGGAHHVEDVVLRARRDA